MGQTISSVSQMVSYAGDLRRAAKLTPDDENAVKMNQVAKTLETQALDRSGITNPAVGKLLDLLT